MTKQRRFAEGTGVSVEKTRSELDALLAKHGAAERAIYVDDSTGRIRVQFRMQQRMIRLDMITRPPKPKYGAPNQRKVEQFSREAWRRLLLVTKAKLEIVADGCRSLEEEFLANVLLPDGSTVHERLAEQLQQSYDTGNMPKLLGDGT